MAKKHEMKRGGRHHHKRGGKVQEYNAQGSHEMREAKETADEGFKKGGAAKKKRRHEKLKHGGHAEGHAAKHRADRKPRRAMGGRTPYSEGHKTSMPSNAGKTDTGHESQRPPEGG